MKLDRQRFVHELKMYVKAALYVALIVGFVVCTAWAATKLATFSPITFKFVVFGIIFLALVRAVRGTMND